MKIRCAILLFGFALGSTVVAGQADNTVLAVIHYNLKYVVDTNARDNPTNQGYMLLLGKNASRCADYFKVMYENGTPIKQVMSDGTGRLENIAIASNGVTEDYFKTFGDNKLTTITYLESNKYAIEEPLPVIHWKTYKDRKSIQNYLCQKAVGSFKGRNYTAWFAPELPFSNGPWKLGGLPGLILEAYDDQNEVYFQCISIETTPGVRFIRYPEAIKIDPSKFSKLQAAIKKDPAATIGSANISASGGSMAAGGLMNPGSKSRPRESNNPLEKQP